MEYILVTVYTFSLLLSFSVETHLKPCELTAHQDAQLKTTLLIRQFLRKQGFLFARKIYLELRHVQLCDIEIPHRLSKKYISKLGSSTTEFSRELCYMLKSP